MVTSIKAEVLAEAYAPKIATAIEDAKSLRMTAEANKDRKKLAGLTAILDLAPDNETAEEIHSRIDAIKSRVRTYTGMELTARVFSGHPEIGGNELLAQAGKMAALRCQLEDEENRLLGLANEQLAQSWIQEPTAAGLSFRRGENNTVVPFVSMKRGKSASVSNGTAAEAIDDNDAVLAVE